MRGRFQTWTRVRVNLQHVPEALRPVQEPLDPNDNIADDWRGVSAMDWPHRKTARRSDP